MLLAYTKLDSGRMPFRVGHSLAPVRLKTLPKGIGVLFLSSMNAPIVLLAFVTAFVCVAFGCKEPDDKF